MIVRYKKIKMTNQYLPYVIIPSDEIPVKNLQDQSFCYNLFRGHLKNFVSANTKI